MTTRCACGCDESVTIARNGKPNRWLRGHHLRGVPKSKEHRQLIAKASIGRAGPWLGKRMPESARIKMSLAKKGRPLRAEHRAKIAESMTGKAHTSKHHPQSAATKLKKSLAQRGDKGSNWRGGISEESRLIRASLQFREWRLEVLRRDRFACKKCGGRHAKGSRPDLHAHHIKPFALFPELRFVVENGVTLCSKCHVETHAEMRVSGNG